MSDFNLNRLRHFVEVVRAGTFTAAAEKFGVGKAIISHQVAKLEEELGTSLLVRTTRSLHMTSAGEEFFERAIRILELAEEAELALIEETRTPSGRLTITAPEDFGQKVVAEVLVELQRQYPALNINIMFTDDQLDLVREGIDVSIRVGWLKDSTNIARKIANFSQYALASPEYLEKCGSISSPEDLRDKNWIVNQKLGADMNWHSPSGEKVRIKPKRATFTVSNSATAHICTRQHAGIAILPSYQVADDIRDGKLSIVLPDWTLPEGGIYLVYPNNIYRPAKVQCFADAMIKAAREL